MYDIGMGIKVTEVISLRDRKKKQFKTHRLCSGTVMPDPGVLSDSQLESVVGGMSPEMFENWRARIVNENA